MISSNHLADPSAARWGTDPVVDRAESYLDNADALTQALGDDVIRLSESLSDKFEEVRLIHDLTARLELDDDPADVCHDLLQQLARCVSCRSLLIRLEADEDQSGSCLGVGEPLGSDEVEALISELLPHQRTTTSCDNGPPEPIVLNAGRTPMLSNRRAATLTIQRRNVLLGRLIAVRDRDDEEFGTPEVDLLRSVSMVLSLHLVSQRQYAEMQSMLEGTVRSLASALDAKDAYTHGHSSRVADLATELAHRLGLDHRSAEALQLAGILHDIGKIGIDDSVLKKPGKLTPEEFDQIKLHPVLGYEILKDIRPFRHILPAVRHHHEAWDGSGYPDGLAGEEIPRDAQILAVADAFDAMVSDRPYRKGMPLEKVRKIFEEGRGTQWAADVVDVLLGSDDLLEEFTRAYQNRVEDDPLTAIARLPQNAPGASS